MRSSAMGVLIVLKQFKNHDNEKNQFIDPKHSLDFRL